jgi:uncharacterized protein DUF6988
MIQQHVIADFCTRLRSLRFEIRFATIRAMSLLDDIGTRGAELRTHMRELLSRRQYSGGIKTRMLAGYVDIALEHHEAIWLLKERKLIGSAFALVRPVYDCWLRALWINVVASEQQIEQAARDELKFPPMHKMQVDIKPGYFSVPASEVDGFIQYLESVWRILSSYTHSGGRQLARRFTGDQVKPSYTDREIAQALNLPTMALMLLMRVFFMSMGDQRDADETHTLLTQYFAEFNERLERGK